MTTDIIHYTTECKSTGFKTTSTSRYIELVKSGEINCYEGLLGADEQLFKPYFDVEIKPKHAKEFYDVEAHLIQMCKDRLGVVFDNAVFAVKSATSASYQSCLTGETTWIISFHIIVSNYLMRKSANKKLVELLNREEMGKREVNDFLELHGEPFELFDTSVYSKDRKIRAVNANKDNCKSGEMLVIEDRPMRLIEGTIEQSIISACFAENAEEIVLNPEAVAEEAKQIAKKATFLTDCKENQSENKAFIKAWLDAGLLSKITGHRTWFNVLSALYNSIGGTTGLSCFECLRTINEDYLQTHEKALYDNYIDYYQNKEKTNATIKTLHYLAKLENKDKYFEILRTLKPPKNKKGEEVDLIADGYSTGSFADYFKILYGDQFICNYDQLFFYNGVFWEKDDKKNSNLTNFFDKTFYKDLLKYFIDELTKVRSIVATSKEEEALITSKIKIINAGLARVAGLRNGASRKSVIDDIIVFLTNNKIVFDNKPFLFAFNNCIFDLETDTFIEPDPEHYISKTAGYDYNFEYLAEDLKYLHDFIDNIHPCKDVKDYYLSILATGMCGIQIENIFIATGTGGNGKGVINQLMLQMSGEYGYKLGSNVLLSSIKEGANPEIANMDCKRFILTTEPNAKKKIVCATLKEITGEKTINARGLYSSKTKTSMVNTTVMEANTIPEFDEVNDAMDRRVRAVPFESKAVDADTYNALDPEMRQNIFIANPYYKSDEFQHKYKQALFDILKEKFVAFRKAGYRLQSQPEKVKTKTQKLLKSSDEIYTWFNENYEQCEGEIIKLNDIHELLQSSKLWTEMNKAERKNLAKKSVFEDKFETNLFLSKYVKPRKSYYNKVRLDAVSVCGWRLIPQTEDDNKNDDDMN
jgi:phage/plasmid-associated DNA primase